MTGGSSGKRMKVFLLLFLQKKKVLACLGAGVA
jgi:hypothetical protein